MVVKPALNSKKTVYLLTILLLLLLPGWFDGHSVQRYPAGSLESFLPPVDGADSDWRAEDDLQEYRGEDLFLLINGGAEIYYEYGFDRVAARGYRYRNGKAVNVEIYQMVGSASAFGIYSLKTGRGGQRLNFGDRALLEDYYLNFWKGPYLVTLTGFDSQKGTITALTTMAEYIDARIDTRGPEPELVSRLPENGLAGDSVKYLKGHLALFNVYPFSSQNLFELTEGVAAEYSGVNLFVFSYDTGRSASRSFNRAAKILNAEKRFSQLVISADRLSGISQKNKHLLLQRSGRFIYAGLGEKAESVKTELERLAVLLGSR